MLKITIPNFCVPEIKYTCFVIFSEWLEIEYTIQTVEQNFILISRNENSLKLNADFFVKASNSWLASKTMPDVPLKNYNLDELKTVLHNEIHICESEFPVLYGMPEITVSEDTIDCNIDILGSIFFMISR